MKKIIYFISLSLFLTHCGDQYGLGLEDEMRDSNDLDELVEEWSQGDFSEDEESMEEIVEEDHFEDNPVVQTALSVAENDSQEKPEWTQDLHTRIEPKKTGKKNLRKRIPQTQGSDLVGGDALSPDAGLEDGIEGGKKSKKGRKGRKGKTGRHGKGKGKGKGKQGSQHHKGGPINLDETMSGGGTGSSEVVTDTPQPKLDVLFVVDNSGSMDYFLSSIDSKMQGFLNPLHHYDWRMGFISASVKKNESTQPFISLERQGTLIQDTKFLSKKTGRSEQVLMDTVTKGETAYLSSSLKRVKTGFCNPPLCGSKKERPLASLNKFLKSPQGFLREGSGLAVVVLTDGFENEPNRKGRVTTHKDVLKSLIAAKGSAYNKVYSVSVDSASCKQEFRSHQNYLFPEGRFSYLLEKLVESTGGSKFSLCSNSYVSLSEKIAQDYLTAYSASL